MHWRKLNPNFIRMDFMQKYFPRCMLLHRTNVSDTKYKIHIDTNIFFCTSYRVDVNIAHIHLLQIRSIQCECTNQIYQIRNLKFIWTKIMLFCTMYLVDVIITNMTISISCKLCICIIYVHMLLLCSVLLCYTFLWIHVICSVISFSVAHSLALGQSENIQSSKAI